MRAEGIFPTWPRPNRETPSWAPLPGLYAYVEGATTVYLKWNPIPGATSYNIYRCLSSTSPPALLASSNNPYYTDSPGLIENDSYNYLVTAVYPGGEGPQSSLISAVPGSTPSAAPMVGMSQSGTTVNIYWNLIPQATSYVVYRTTITTGNPVTIVTGITPSQGSTSGVYTDSSLVPGLDYSYTVAATNPDGTGLQSPYPVHVSPGASKPSAVTGIAAGSQGTANITLQWNPTTTFATYYIYRATATGKEGDVPVGFSATPIWVDKNAVAGTLYYYVVQASDGQNLSAISQECSAEAGAASLVSPVITGYPGSSSNVLKWTAVPEATSYNLYRTNAMDGTFVLYQQGLSGESYTDTNVSSADNFYYMVQAVDKYGAGNQSSVVSLRPGAVFNGQTSGIYVLAIGPSNSVSWNAVPGAQSYNVFRSSTSGTEGEVPVATGITTLNFNDPSVTTGTTYYYTVAAVTPDTQGPQSTEVSCQTGSTPLSSPALVGSSVPGGIGLTWHAISGATSYNIFRNDSTGWVLYVQGFVPSGSPSYKDTNVIDGVNYTYSVSAVNATGSGSQSNQVQVNP